MNLEKSQLPEAAPAEALKHEQNQANRSPPAHTNGVSLDCTIGQNPNRWTSCSSRVWVVNNYVVVNGTPVWRGSMSIRVASSVEFAEGDGSDWFLDTTVTVEDAKESRAAGAAGTMWTGCFQHQDKCTTSQLQGTNGEPENVSLTKDAPVDKTYTQYAGTMANNQIRPLDGFLGSRVEVRPASGNAAVVTYDTRSNPAVGPVAQHVFTAIRTLPSHWGDPRHGQALNRVTDDKTIESNRNAVCGGVTVPTGQSCDEYPLASADQGGTYAAPNNRLIAVVPLQANNSQGGLTSSAYDLYRVLDGNDFYVQAVLADGSSAW
ncbi:NucA/NucB deoxyribonuclease domain-containing protein [Amycolatopsis sp. NPDC088138]|uniref:NucA/NucB deoxyribonuclease domain-containing protein n=1 Tax=Amycolatopsis sp. NPDC088138 TaxID=3363938 RepID=UPI00381FFA6B